MSFLGNPAGEIIKGPRARAFYLLFHLIYESLEGFRTVLGKIR